MSKGVTIVHKWTCGCSTEQHMSRHQLNNLESAIKPRDIGQLRCYVQGHDGKLFYVHIEQAPAVSTADQSVVGEMTAEQVLDEAEGQLRHDFHGRY